MTESRGGGTGWPSLAIDQGSDCPQLAIQETRVRKRTPGYSLLEILAVISIIGLLLLVTIPALDTIGKKAMMRAASADLRSILHLARSRAIAQGGNCGLRFVRLAGVWHYAIYDDVDGDGVRTDDILRGTDVLVRPPRVVFPSSRAVTIGLLPYPIRDPSGDPLLPSSSPVRFNRSSICSFSPIGESTPGTVYLTDGRDDLYAVRVYGMTAKIRVLRYHHGMRRWIP